MSKNLGNRVALVTGGSRGIGKAIVLALGEVGAAVAVANRERGQEATAVVDAIHESGGRAAAIWRIRRENDRGAMMAPRSLV